MKYPKSTVGLDASMLVSSIHLQESKSGSTSLAIDALGIVHLQQEEIQSLHVAPVFRVSISRVPNER
jgi:hypothetical protein